MIGLTTSPAIKAHTRMQPATLLHNAYYIHIRDGKQKIVAEKKRFPQRRSQSRIHLFATPDTYFGGPFRFAPPPIALSISLRKPSCVCSAVSRPDKTTALRCNTYT